ncbi:MAG TPA: YlxR family protein [Mycobacteriales bacterium]|nr:YlxR family protein [Mycobacteriales bacterium]
MTRRSTDPPSRTCVGCRTRAAKPDLLRVVAVEGVLVPDEHGRLPGRGAYLHRDPDCLLRAERRRVWSRALRVPVTLSAAVADAMGQASDIRAGRPPAPGPG